MLASLDVLEREAELAAVGRLLDAARAGGGGTLLLEGAPGLGKSTLVDRAPGLADGMLVLRAAGRELEQGLGWGVARSLFEALAVAEPELLSGPAAPAAALLGGPGDAPPGDLSFAIQHALFWLTVRLAEREPVLLVVDDAHWADEPSLRFVAYLAARLAEQPIAVVVATRPWAAGAALDQLAADATVLDLAPLGAASVAALVRRRLADADERFCRRCFELTAGNPLQVRELVTAVVPGDLDASAVRAARSLSRSVLRRLGALSESAQALARAVAVVEGGVALHQAAALAGLALEDAPAAADQLAHADLVSEGEPLRFTHPLLRAAVYGAMPRARRAAGHRAAARLLAAEGAAPETVAAHLLEAVPAGDAEVVAGLRRAAAQALAHGVPSSAIAYLERALREPPAAAERPEVLAALGRAKLIAGDRAAAAHLEAAIRLVDSPRRRAELRLDLARTLHDAGRVDEACALLEDAGDEDPELSAELQAGYLTSAMVAPGYAAEAHRRIDDLLARAPRARGRAERALASKALIMRVYTGGTRDALVPLARALYDDGRLIEEDGIVTQALGHVMGTLSYCDEYAAAREVMDAASAEAARMGWVVWYAAACQLRARQELWTGPLPDAIDNSRTAVETFAAGLQLYLPASAYCLARGLIEAGEHDEAQAVIDVVARAREPRGGFAAWFHEARGRLAAARGDHEGALAEFLETGSHAAQVLVTNPGMFHWRSEAGLAALKLGRREQARGLIAEELVLAERFGAPRAVGVALRAQALLERGEAAVAGLERAAAVLGGCGARMEHASALVELGAAQRRAGRPGEARTTLRSAVALADSLGARAVARRGRDELVRAGGSAPAAEDGRGLTPSERRVAELAAAGHTNRQIADELFVTVKAVEWHLGNTYRKLDIRGRARLGAALAAA